MGRERTSAPCTRGRVVDYCDLASIQAFFAQTAVSRSPRPALLCGVSWRGASFDGA